MNRITVEKPVVLTTADWLRTNNLSITLRISKPLRFRIWLGLRFLSAAVFLIGGRLNDDDGNDRAYKQPKTPWPSETK